MESAFIGVHRRLILARVAPEARARANAARAPRFPFRCVRERGHAADPRERRPVGGIAAGGRGAGVRGSGRGLGAALVTGATKRQSRHAPVGPGDKPGARESDEVRRPFIGCRVASADAKPRSRSGIGVRLFDFKAARIYRLLASPTAPTAPRVISMRPAAGCKITVDPEVNR